MVTYEIRVKRVAHANLGGGCGGASPAGVSPSSPKPPEELAAFRSRRAERAALRRRIAEIIPHERVSICGRNVIEGKTPAVYRSLESGTCHVGGVMRCGSVWTCPECAAKIATRRAAEIEQAVLNHLASGGHVHFMTLTVNHSIEDDLADLLKRFGKALRGLFTGGAHHDWRYATGYVGMIKALEVTWGTSNGWHPHVHILMFTKGFNCLADNLRLRWTKVTSRYGFEVDPTIGCRVDRVLDAATASSSIAGYMAKSADGAGAEMSHGHTKNGRDRFTPFDLARSGDEIIESRGRSWMPAFLFVDYVEHFKGKRQHVWSRGLRDALGLGAAASDEDLANAEVEQAELVYALAPDLWRRVWRSGRVAEMLAVAEADGAWGLDFWLYAFTYEPQIKRGRYPG